MWIALGVAVALVGVIAVWRVRRRRRTRLISFVSLVREPVVFDPAVLARIAGEAWNADLGEAHRKERTALWSAVARSSQ
jgi:hypothetical protein